MEKTQYFENAKNNDILSYVYMENEKVLAKNKRAGINWMQYLFLFYY